MLLVVSPLQCLPPRASSPWSGCEGTRRVQKSRSRTKIVQRISISVWPGDALPLRCTPSRKYCTCYVHTRDHATRQVRDKTPLHILSLPWMPHKETNHCSHHSLLGEHLPALASYGHPLVSVECMALGVLGLHAHALRLLPGSIELPHLGGLDGKRRERARQILRGAQTRDGRALPFCRRQN